MITLSTSLEILIGAGLLLLFASVVWHLFESRWDRRLFDGEENNPSKNLTAAQAAELLDSDSPPTILDVRTRSEYDRAHLPGAQQICPHEPDFNEKIRSLDTGKPYLVYCAGGYKSRKFCGIMKELGFREFYNLHRGILSWRLRGKALEK